jgi:hypothetical protein
MAAVATETSQYTMTPRTRTPRKMARVENSDTSEFEASDVNLAPRGKWHSFIPSVTWELLSPASARSARTALPRASKATGIWRVVVPSRGGSAVHPSKPPRVPATDLRPRVWTGVRLTCFPFKRKNCPVLISDTVFICDLGYG